MIRWGECEENLGLVIYRERERERVRVLVGRIGGGPISCLGEMLRQENWEVVCACNKW
jgi:hypothetical protein